MQACALRLELRIPEVRSLKGKRAVLRPHIERVRRQVSVSVAEVANHEYWQRATIGVAIVAPDPAQLDSLIDRVGHYFDSQIDVELVEMSVSYLEEP